MEYDVAERLRFLAEDVKNALSQALKCTGEREETRWTLHELESDFKVWMSSWQVFVPNIKLLDRFLVESPLATVRVCDLLSDLAQELQKVASFFSTESGIRPPSGTVEVILVDDDEEESDSDDDDTQMIIDKVSSGETKAVEAESDREHARKQQAAITQCELLLKMLYRLSTRIQLSWSRAERSVAGEHPSQGFLGFDDSIRKYGTHRDSGMRESLVRDRVASWIGIDQYDPGEIQSEVDGPPQLDAFPQSYSFDEFFDGPSESSTLYLLSNTSNADNDTEPTVGSMISLDPTSDMIMYMDLSSIGPTVTFCAVCSEGFRGTELEVLAHSKASHEDHVKIGHGFLCPWPSCSTIRAGRADLLRHADIPHYSVEDGIRRCMYPLCNTVSVTSMDADRHYMHYHRDRNLPDFKCLIDHCERSKFGFRREVHLKAHMKFLHDRKSKQPGC